LGIVLDACGNWRELAKDGEIRNWRDFLAAAEVARPMLGISPSAWRDACAALGERQAAITLAAIYQRADQINSAGGYLRSLTDRARNGKFSAWPMIMALLRAKLDAEKAAVETPGGSPDDGEKREGRIEVSEALLRSLRRPKS
jgi:replication initiation protein RepC